MSDLAAYPQRYTLRPSLGPVQTVLDVSPTPTVTRLTKAGVSRERVAQTAQQVQVRHGRFRATVRTQASGLSTPAKSRRLRIAVTKLPSFPARHDPVQRSRPLE